MLKYIVSPNTKMLNVLLKTSCFEKSDLICVVNENKLLGIITYGDIRRLLSSTDNIDFDSVSAYEFSNKEFTKFQTNNLDYDIIDFIKNKKTIFAVPCVDIDDNLITVLDVDTFLNEQAWQNSQKYELNYQKLRKTLKQNILYTKDLYEQKREISTIWNFDLSLESKIITHVKDKNVLEIGCGPVFGYLPQFWAARKRIAIEPLLDEYAKLWNDICDINIVESGLITEPYSQGADMFIPELAGEIDGLIISQNSLDHTPNWPFVLSNISSYASVGSFLCLWTDVFHGNKPNDGHYNITPNYENLVRLVENMGFNILSASTNKPLEKNNIYVQMIAVKC